MEEEKDYPPDLYSWDADGGDGRTVGGVTDDLDAARHRLLTAMRDLPGTEGTVHQVYLDIRWQHEYGRVVVRIQRDEATTALIHFEEQPCPTS